jgi:threonine synthase
MIYYSTNNINYHVSFREAVLSGLAPDGGLFMPAEIPRLNPALIARMTSMSFQEIAYEVALNFIDSVTVTDLRRIIEKTITFDAPLVSLSKELSVLELFHGPTLAFKDFGARFLANLMTYYNRDQKSEIIILVATSGDTGSAVAHGFYDCAGIKVGLLYPSGKVSRIQEQQLTTLDKNIFAFEIDGTFDDCQMLVKKAFLDTDLKAKYTLSSANSINIARLIPQSFYYFNAYARLGYGEKSPVFCVPCGNFGNLTAGLIAWKMGLPVAYFIAALNSNRVFLDYLETGGFQPKAAIKTMSNAMDVGNPSNFERILNIFEYNPAAIRQKIMSYTTSDKETRQTIDMVYKKHGYILDPHGAVGYAAWKKHKTGQKIVNHTIILETAHPAKFLDVMPGMLTEKIVMPQRLQTALEKQKKSTKIPADFQAFKAVLLGGLK